MEVSDFVVQKFNLFQEKLCEFILASQDDETGGFADRPGDMVRFLAQNCYYSHNLQKFLALLKSLKKEGVVLPKRKRVSSEINPSMIRRAQTVPTLWAKILIKNRQTC